ncbi:MAG: insulinase family protein, partial [SAR202 cluster bacterium]|nr:insulinase family protein [SAR202 cluster bacterium]
MITETNDEAEFSRKTTLDGGMRVLTSSIPHARSVSLSIFAGVGSRYEPLNLAGISHVVEHLLFKGTERRPAP